MIQKVRCLMIDNQQSPRKSSLKIANMALIVVSTLLFAGSSVSLIILLFDPTIRPPELDWGGVLNAFMSSLCFIGALWLFGVTIISRKRILLLPLGFVLMFCTIPLSAIVDLFAFRGRIIAVGAIAGIRWITCLIFLLGSIQGEIFELYRKGDAQ